MRYFVATMICIAYCQQINAQSGSILEDAGAFVNHTPDDLLDIYHGQYGSPLTDSVNILHDGTTDGGGDDAEWIIGAVSAANSQNNTDDDSIFGQPIMDADDMEKMDLSWGGGNPPGVKKEHSMMHAGAWTGRDEIDLVRFVIKKPANFNVVWSHLTFANTGTIKLWEDPLKSTPFNDFESKQTYSHNGQAYVVWKLDNFEIFGTENERVIWIELVETSLSLGDYEFAILHTLVPQSGSPPPPMTYDRARATAVGVSSTRFRNSQSSAVFHTSGVFLGGNSITIRDVVGTFGVGTYILIYNDQFDPGVGGMVWNRPKLCKIDAAVPNATNPAWTDLTLDTSLPAGIDDGSLVLEGPSKEADNTSYLYQWHGNHRWRSRLGTNHTWQMQNGAEIGFKITPAEVKSIELNGQPLVQFDVTRSIEGEFYNNGVLDKEDDFPLGNEWTNDDTGSGEEDNEPSDEGWIFALDFPGFYPPASGHPTFNTTSILGGFAEADLGEILTGDTEFKEFVRMRIGEEFTDDPTAGWQPPKGTRICFDLEWKSKSRRKIVKLYSGSTVEVNWPTPNVGAPGNLIEKK